MNALKHVNRASAAMVAYALPDRCKIRIPTGNPTISTSGRLTSSQAYRTYAGSQNIPCRLDISRAQRAESTEVQEVIASEHTIYLPPDVEVRPDDQIEFTINGRLRVFEIRKIADISAWDAATEATVTELEFQHGEPG